MFDNVDTYDKDLDYISNTTRSLFAKLVEKYKLNSDIRIIPEGSDEILSEDDPTSINIKGMVKYNESYTKFFIFINELSSSNHDIKKLNDTIIHELTHVLMHSLGIHEFDDFESYYAIILKISGLEVKRMKYDSRHFAEFKLRLKAANGKYVNSSIKILTVEEARKEMQGETWLSDPPYTNDEARKRGMS